MRWMIWFMAGLFLMGLVALQVSAQEEKKEETKKEEAKPDEGVPPPPERPKSQEEAVKNAGMILVGVVDFVGDKPGDWGKPPYRPNTQYIRYEVVKFLKGNYPAKKIMVIHQLLKGAKTCSEQPGLSPGIFAVDKKVILLLDKEPVDSNPISFLCTDPDFGAMPWSEEDEKKITGMIGK